MKVVIEQNAKGWDSVTFSEGEWSILFQLLKKEGDQELEIPELDQWSAIIASAKASYARHKATKIESE